MDIDRLPQTLPGAGAIQMVPSGEMDMGHTECLINKGEHPIV